MTLPPNHYTVEFWRSLCEGNVTTTQDWITLQEGIYWMGTKVYGRHLYIRKIYNLFWEAVTGSKKTWTIAGTPCIGKTFFSFFLFYKIR